jgi:hypothetical protein
MRVTIKIRISFEISNINASIIKRIKEIKADVINDVLIISFNKTARPKISNIKITLFFLPSYRRKLI